MAVIEVGTLVKCDTQDVVFGKPAFGKVISIYSFPEESIFKVVIFHPLGGHCYSIRCSSRELEPIDFPLSVEDQETLLIMISGFSGRLDEVRERIKSNNKLK